MAPIYSTVELRKLLGFIRRNPLLDTTAFIAVYLMKTTVASSLRAGRGDHYRSSRWHYL